jgi:predicted transcriptional regulator
VVYQANLNFNTANHHIAELQKLGLLEEDMRGSMEVYQTTSKGIDFKEQMKDIDKMMDS